MATVNTNECEAAGVDPKKVRSIVTRLERAALDAQALGLTVFGTGWGSANVRTSRVLGEGQLILGTAQGSWDGGDGGSTIGADGLERGE